MQGLTEFLPVSSTAHLLIGEPAARVRGSGRRVHRDDPARLDPRGDVAVSREDPRRASPGLPSDPEARRFALMLVRRDRARRSSPARCSSEFVKRVLYDSFAVIAVAFIVGGIVMLVVERFRPAPDVRDVDDTPVGQRARRSASCQTLALIPASRARARTIVGGDADRARSRRRRRSSRSSSRCRRWPRRSRTSLLEVRHNLAPARGARRSRSAS